MLQPVCLGMFIVLPIIIGPAVQGIYYYPKSDGKYNGSSHYLEICCNATSQATHLSIEDNCIKLFFCHNASYNCSMQTIAVHTLQATQDLCLEKGITNYNYLDYLILGKHPEYPKKRSLVQFEDIPEDCTNIVSAKMYIWYWRSHKPSWQTNQQVPFLNHIFKVHQVKKQWSETQATSSYRLSGVPWSQPYLALDGTDADANYLDSVYFPNPPPTGDDRWIEFDITAAVKNWIGGQPNYGVVIWSNQEDNSGRDVRFYSREHSTNRPYMKVVCK